jgi:oligopeptide transport system ATP-binding protein
VLITHDLGVVAGVADRMMVMYGGRCVEKGPTDSLFYDPQPPLHAGPVALDPACGEAGQATRPDPGSAAQSRSTCPRAAPSHPRCAFRFDRCFAERPPLLPVEDDREKACWHQGELNYEEVVVMQAAPAEDLIKVE